MKLCILGGRGMLGHTMFEVLHEDFVAPTDQLWMTVNGSALDNPEVVERYGAAQLIESFNALHPEACCNVLREMRPDVVVNCIAVVKQRADAQTDSIRALTVNALFPQHVARAAQEWGGRVIHFSTDCVFSGNRGHYRETDIPDADDLYGRTKLLGELHAENALTLRTSMIGPELAHHASLHDWFLNEAQRTGRVKGYRRATFSGLTTRRLAEITAELIAEHTDLQGLYHLAGEPISKLDLLVKLRDAYALRVDIVPDDQVNIDRTLDGSRFEQATGMTRPTWDDMVAQMTAGAVRVGADD
jgi:dTDP-4-dehydrorhamnose reductase